MQLAEHPRPDPTRIAAMSGAISLNALALALLLVPISMPSAPPEARAAPPPDLLEAVFVPREPRPELRRVAPVPRLDPPRVPVPRERTPDVAPRPIDFVVEDAVLPQLVDFPPADAVEPEGSEPDAPLEVASIGHDRIAQPVYPRLSIKRREQGTVLLRVIVETDGYPSHVAVERSSGHRRLDDVARRTVEAKWRFKPAMREGRPVRASALVPIEFSLANG